MSRDETPDTTGLREHSHPTGGAWHVTRWQVPGCPACLPTPDASPDPAVVTPDAGDVEALAAHLDAWMDEFDSDTPQEAARRILASDWLANHVAAAREADRAEVERAITEHAAHMGTYTIPAMSPGFIDGYHQALRLLARDAGAIAHRATRGES